MPRDIITDFRDGIFALNTRRFGNVAELMIQEMFGLEDSGTTKYDKFDPRYGNRIEVKFSKASKKHDTTITRVNLVDSCLHAPDFASEIIASNEVDSIPFDSNIQQVKPDQFDVLFYGQFFLDIITIYSVSSASIEVLPNYSNKQHRGNTGEGQFHLNNRTIHLHRDYLQREITYRDLFEMFYYRR